MALRADVRGRAPRPALFVQAAPACGAKRVLERAMRDDDWQKAGAGWQGKWGAVWLRGWSRQRRVVLVRRRLNQVLLTERPTMADAAAAAPVRLGLCRV